MLHSLIVSSNIWVLSSSVGFKELISEQLSQFTAILLKFLDSVLWNEEFKVKQAKSSGSSITLHLGKLGICYSCWSVLPLSCMAVLCSEECLLLWHSAACKKLEGKINCCGWRSVAVAVLQCLHPAAFSGGLFKKQCHSSEGFGILGFHCVSVKPGIFAEAVFNLFRDLNVFTFYFHVTNENRCLHFDYLCENWLLASGSEQVHSVSSF